MRTLYLRNVPDDVVRGLERLARRENMSVSAYATRELAAAARRANNAQLLAELPPVQVDDESVLAALDEGRSQR